MKKLIWIGSSYKDFMEFPIPVRAAVGYALHYAQEGRRHEHTKTLSGMGSEGLGKEISNEHKKIKKEEPR